MDFITKWRIEATKWTASTAASISAVINKKEEVSDLSDEQLEELRMVSNFSLKEIKRLRREFLRITQGSDRITRHNFLSIPCIAVNPLQDRIATIFGFPEEESKQVQDVEGPLPDPMVVADSKDVNDGNDAKVVDADAAGKQGQQLNTETREEDKIVDNDKDKVKDKDEDKDKDKDKVKDEDKDKDGWVKVIGDDGVSNPISGIEPNPDGDDNDNGGAATTILPALNRSSDESADLAVHSSLDFASFLTGIALFNAPGKLEEKLRVAFRIHDFDGDNFISREDMTQYMRLVTTPDFESELEQVMEELFHECASDARKQKLSYSDFQRVLINTDFRVKLRLPI